MRLGVLLSVGMLSAAAAVGPEQTVELIPLDVLARGPEVASVKMAPDGRRLAMVATVDGRRAIVLSDVNGEDRRTVYRNPQRSIGDVAWSGDGRWLYTFQDAGGDEGYHLFRVHPDRPGTAVDLTPFPGSRADLIATPTPPAGIVPITLDRRDREWPDAFSLDLATGALTEQVRNTIGATDFFADRSGQVLAATATRADGRLELLASDRAGGWPVRYTAPPSERFRVVSLTPDGAAAIVRTNRGRPAEVLMRIDLASGRQTPVPGGACGRFDVEGLRFTATGAVAAIECITERPTLIAGSAGLAKAIASVRTFAGPDAGLRLESGSADGSAAIFYADASDRPGRFLRWTPEGIREVATSRPNLAGARLARSRPHWIRARDGLLLLAYVTRPAGAVGPLPMVIAIHGGPWTRDTGGYESETQLLANRGYAVLQVNFRGSTGLGRAVFNSGVGEFGRRMSDDIDDAAAWAVRRGLARRDRICLLGGSFGGYASLMGLVREPGRYRCAIDYAGPADLATLVGSFPPGWGPFLPRSWYRFVGDPRQPGVREELGSRSPLSGADRIVAPLLIFQGANDPRVTQAQSDRIVCALRRRGIEAEYLLAGNEGHSFANEETGLAVNRAVELFLATHLGGRAAGPASPRAEEALRALRQAGAALACPRSSPSAK